MTTFPTTFPFETKTKDGRDVTIFAKGSGYFFGFSMGAAFVCFDDGWAHNGMSADGIVPPPPPFDATVEWAKLPDYIQDAAVQLMRSNRIIAAVRFIRSYGKANNGPDGLVNCKAIVECGYRLSPVYEDDQRERY